MNRCADKFGMSGYLKEKGLEKHQNEVYGIWDNVENIDLKICHVNL